MPLTIQRVRKQNAWNPDFFFLLHSNFYSKSGFQVNVGQPFVIPHCFNVKASSESHSIAIKRSDVNYVGTNVDLSFQARQEWWIFIPI